MDARTLCGTVIRHRHPSDHRSRTIGGVDQHANAYDSRFAALFPNDAEQCFRLVCARTALPNVPTHVSVKIGLLLRCFQPGDVSIDYEWSGLVALNRSETPYIGEAQDTRGYAGFGYHGNGVAMASYSGALLSDMVLDRIGTR